MRRSPRLDPDLPEAGVADRTELLLLMQNQPYRLAVGEG